MNYHPNPLIQASMVVEENESVVFYSRPLPDYLDDLEQWRRYLISELRRIDGELMQHGRLGRPTLPERVR